MYGSKNSEGTGEQFQHVQTLTTRQQAQTHFEGYLEFVQAYGKMDVSSIGCGEYRFLCFDFMKGVDAYPDFNFTSLQKADRSKLTVCQEWACSNQGVLHCQIVNFLLIRLSAVSFPAFDVCQQSKVYSGSIFR